MSQGRNHRGIKILKDELKWRHTHQNLGNAANVFHRGQFIAVNAFF